MTGLNMRVRVGWITRTETLSFNEAFGLAFPVRPCSAYRK
jgi:hypothetical protein